MISKGFKVIEPIVIAEIGCNHKGDILIAKKMIEQISLMGDVNPLSKINCIKFQKQTKFFYHQKNTMPHILCQKTHMAKLMANIGNF